MNKRIRDYDIKIGELPTGKLNKITDVDGVTVGHSTIDTDNNKTGVTVLIPTQENIFVKNLVAASYIINGFGKTAGLVQIDELGTLESIIGFTNTLNLGKVHDGIVDYTIGRCRDENVEITSFNPVVAECNDSFLNNIVDRVVEKENVLLAIANAKEDFEEGDVGAGKGMSCHGLKGGIGSASRVIELDGESYTTGVMVLSNYGLMEDLTLDGKKVGRELKKIIDAESREEEGSIIIVVATDLPVTSRQLKRLCKRAVVGLGRVGSNINNGSGDIVIGFSTGNIIDKNDTNNFREIKSIRDDKLNLFFKGVAEATEEAILNSMVGANKVVGYKKHVRHSLKDYIDKIK